MPYRLGNESRIAMKQLASYVEVSPDSIESGPTKQMIGRLLIDAGRLTLEDTEAIAAAQRTMGIRFGEAGIKLGLLTEVQVKQALSSQFGYSFLQPGQGRFSSDLIVAYQPFSQQADMVRKLRTELLLRWFNPERKSLALVSAGTGEGRSYLTANLAVSFAQLGHKTLLIDADMRSPRLHKVFDCDDSVGLSTILGGRATSYFDGIEHVIALPGLYVLPAGPTPPNPLELLGQLGFEVLLEFLSQNYEVILIDTPSGALYADAQVIAARAGGALILARKNVTKTAELKRMTDTLAASRTSIVGTVMSYH